MWSLDTSVTGLNGVTELDGAPELTELNLASDAIGGTIPWQIFELNALEALLLDHDNLSSEIYGYNAMELKHLKIFTSEENQTTGTTRGFVRL